MESGFGESTKAFEPSASFSANSSIDAGDFECNICFDLAQDPVITLCGHLFCWPCLYRWLHHHSHCQECPVCKALVQEEKLVPLYGRGKTQTDPRTKSYPGMEIPHRPSGQRPPTAPPPPDVNPFRNNSGFGLMGGFLPMASARIGSFTLATAFGGFIPSLLNIHLHGLQDVAVFGAATGIPYVVNTFHGTGNARGFPQATGQVQQPQEDHVLKNLFLLIGFLVLLTVIFVW